MVKNFEDIFIRFGATHERDKRTDGQTPGDSNSRAMHSIARQKSDPSACADHHLLISFASAVALYAIDRIEGSMAR